MGNTTASLRATTVVPRTTKPVLRLWADMIRLEGLVKDAEGVSRMRRAATALYDAAIFDKNTAALAIIGDRLDGKVATMPDENGQVSLSFVVRLPQQLDAEQWQAMVANPRPAVRIVDVEDDARAESASDPEPTAVELSADPIAVELAVEPLAVDQVDGDGLPDMVKRTQEPAK